jgi:hypothetical protein
MNNECYTVTDAAGLMMTTTHQRSCQEMNAQSPEVLAILQKYPNSITMEVAIDMALMQARTEASDKRAEASDMRAAASAFSNALRALSKSHLLDDGNSFVASSDTDPPPKHLCRMCSCLRHRHRHTRHRPV